ncbi:putative nuclease HARBI1 [Amyelois transitella]|uniref:putative nuclease HARBI1 n=1 Tax=Amyelois transitella TaxID=680683 RepID=UPI00298FD0C8|nr:putative nuclease HARBI1 [Amyelois transitella]
MCDEYELFEFLESDFNESRMANKKKRLRNRENNDPFDLDENAFIKEYRFFNKFGIPGVIGCIDCTHVRIVRPNEHEDRYFCRKKFHSLNVQLICDADQQILSVDASHPGSFHDSFIWSYHPVRYHLENLGPEETWLLGDSGYSQRRTMMTPILDAEPSGYMCFRCVYTGSILYTKACKG